MTTIKEIAKMLHALGRKASMDGAREYVLSHYDSAMPAYWQDPAPRSMCLTHSWKHESLTATKAR